MSLKRHKKQFVILLVGLAVQGATAQGVGGVRGVPAVDAGVRQPLEYTLGAGDTLSVEVADMPEISTRSVKIGSDGSLDLPLIGSTQASGITVGQLRTALATRLAKYVNNPAVTINVVNNGSRFVSVVGEVNTPGLHPLDGPRSLIEVISQAGGVKADAGARVIVTRDLHAGPFPAVAGVQPMESGTSTRLSLSLTELLTSASPAANIAILPGDVITIPKEQLVYVVGDVKRAGGFPMASRESVSVLQALSLAEGPVPNASLSSAKILRPGPSSQSLPTEVSIKLDKILAGKAPDQALYANDVLFVPKSAAKSGTKRVAEVMLQVATGIAIYR